MTEIVIVGGGLSGLAAAWELEQRGLSYTLIEVKGRLGGSIVTEQHDGFLVDGGPFALQQTRDWPWLAQLGLEDALFEMPQYPDTPHRVAFKQGTQTLVDALVARLKQGRIIRRTAVSTLGQMGGQFTLCLENGMVIPAAGLIIAAPARYAERMFYGYVPEISETLRRFHYDAITNIALGYRRDAGIALPIPAPPDIGFAYGFWTDSEYRVPPGHILLQVGMRWPLDRSIPDALIAQLQEHMRWPTDPVITQVNYWPESHCLNPHHHDHAEAVTLIEQYLPDGIALVGSDYRALHFEDRVEQGRAAAARIADWLLR